MLEMAREDTTMEYNIRLVEGGTMVNIHATNALLHRNEMKAGVVWVGVWIANLKIGRAQSRTDTEVRGWLDEEYGMANGALGNLSIMTSLFIANVRMVAQSLCM
ncbi:hypothetical protein V5O48_011279 [Marasmius crinis-equi]|uniref:Uncharacterized protein n=1 Tax=Marasmius crinis-equi TaxID=585013 RepID=A0ABR3F6H6_9AGAR